MYAVEVKNLGKTYNDKKVVNGIDFQIEDRAIVGLLGPNGAGKTTTINMILGLTNRDDGEIKIFGKNADRNRLDINRNIGYVPQELAVYKDLTAIQNVTFFGRLFGLKGKELKAAVKEALEFTGLYDRRKDVTKKFSGGMQRRLNIACAIVSKPTLLIMDEPTVGVDPQSRNSILESIKKLNERGTTILYTSHYMEEVEAICEKIYIMDLGNIIAEGSSTEIISKAVEGHHIVIETNEDPSAVACEIEQISNVDRVSVEGKKISVSIDACNRNLNDIFDKVRTFGLEIISVSNRDHNLETAFLALTGKKLRD